MILKIKHFNFYYFFLLAAVSLFIASCKDRSDTLEIDYMYDYAPVDSGHYVIYDVDSITYNFISPIYYRDTARYQLKEEIGDTFYDNNNELNYELNLYRRANASSSWVFDRKWSVKRTVTTFQKNEGDLRFIKLVFFPQKNLSWGGNNYIPTTAPYRVFLNWDYHYTEVNIPYSVNGLNFDSTLIVSEVDNENLIEKTLRKEVYAKGVGMIYQEWESLTKNVGGNWNDDPRQGFRIRIKVKEYN